MEYPAPARGTPSPFASLQGSLADPGVGGAMLSGVSPQDDWHLQYAAAPSPRGLLGDATGLEVMWQMTLQHHEGMDTTGGPFPERPAEPDCVYYMRTGLCGFGMRCRFNHPSNRKLAAAIAGGKGEYPERFGQPECQYYLKTGTCKFGTTCKYHHPKDKAGSLGRVLPNVVGLPLRPGEKECPFYMRTGYCKYGMTCKFDHPQPTAVNALVSMSGSQMYPASATPSATSPQPFLSGLPTWPIGRATFLPGPRLQGLSAFAPLMLPQNVISAPGWRAYQQGSLGPQALPEGQQQAVGTSFVYGAAAQTETVAAGVHGTFTSYIPGSAAMGLPAIPIQSSCVQRESFFPERPGQPDCQYYIKTGDCKFGMTCRYHHPKDRIAPSPNCILTPIGLPLRPGAPICSFYTRYGICKFGPTCKFDHPMGGLTYSPSASSLVDMPVAPYPIGSSPATLAPSSSEVLAKAASRNLKEYVGSSVEKASLQLPYMNGPEETPNKILKRMAVTSSVSVESGGNASQADLPSST